MKSMWVVEYGKIFCDGHLIGPYSKEKAEEIVAVIGKNARYYAFAREVVFDEEFNWED